MIFALMLPSLASNYSHSSLTHILYALFGFAKFLFSFDFTMFPGVVIWFTKKKQFQRNLLKVFLLLMLNFLYIDFIYCEFCEPSSSVPFFYVY